MPNARPNNSIRFALERLEPGAIVEMRGTEGQILACGVLHRFRIIADFFRIEAISHAEDLADCPSAMASAVKEIRIADIGFLDVRTPESAFYVYENHRWRATEWRRPIKVAMPAFDGSVTESHAWQRYIRPPKMLPGVFWPEIRVGGGAYAMSRTRDAGASVLSTLDFKLHRLLYGFGLLLDFTYHHRIVNGDTTVSSPTKLFSVQTGIKYNLFDREKFTFGILVTGGMVNYYFTDYAAGDQGLRATVGVGALLQYHAWRNNRDYHKLSFFLQPVLNSLINKNSSGESGFPLLAAFFMGAQYGY